MSRESVNRRLKNMKLGRVMSNAFELQEITLDLLDTAPRGGRNLNYFGEYRSAPGEQPATEFGTLRRAIEDGVTLDEPTSTARVTVNRLNLERGIDVDARPMGMMALDLLKARHHG